MGDVAMMIPTLRCLNKSYPDLKITIVSNKLFKPFFNEFENINFFEVNFKTQFKGIKGLFNLFKELVNLKENTLFRNSHRDFVDIFISVLDYHNSKQKKTKLKAYMKLVQPLNYPLFDEEYCINYFDD